MIGLFLQVSLVSLALEILGIHSSDQLILEPQPSNPGRHFNRDVNSSFFITCIHSSHSKETNLRWLHRSNYVSENFVDRTHVESVKDGVSLVFTSIRRSDNGTYICEGQTGNERIKTQFKLMVNSPIVFADSIRHQVATEGEPFALRCDPEGDPEPTIIYLVDDRDAREMPKKYKVLGDSLLIRNVTREDMKKDYICRAVQQNLGRLESTRIELTVNHKPFRPNGSTTINAYGHIGGKTKLVCDVEATPEPLFTWYKNGDIITNSSLTTLYENNTSLMINLVNETLFGEYQCRANNYLGVLYVKFNVREGEKPGVPRKAHVQNTTHNSIHLEIHEPKHKQLEITGFKVQVLEKNQRKDDRDWESAQQVHLLKGEPYVIPDLKSKTDYLIRITAVNEAGDGEFTGEILATTKNSGSSPGNLSVFGIAILLMVATNSLAIQCS